MEFPLHDLVDDLKFQILPQAELHQQRPLEERRRWSSGPDPRGTERNKREDDWLERIFEILARHL